MFGFTSTNVAAIVGQETPILAFEFLVFKRHAKAVRYRCVKCPYAGADRAARTTTRVTVQGPMSGNRVRYRRKTRLQIESNDHPLSEDEMHNETMSDSSREGGATWTWIFLAILLVVGAITAVGAMALINAAQQNEVPTGSQTLPSR